MMLEVKCSMCSNAEEHKVLVQIGGKYLCNTCVANVRAVMEQDTLLRATTPLRKPEYFESKDTLKPVYVFTGFQVKTKPMAPLAPLTA